MKIKLSIIAAALLATTCDSNKEPEIYGTWTSIDVDDYTGMNVTDELAFDKNGNYQMTLFSNGDSVISEMKGSFEIEGEKLKISAMGVSFEHNIIELKEDTLKLETSQGIKMRMVKK